MFLPLGMAWPLACYCLSQLVDNTGEDLENDERPETQR